MSADEWGVEPHGHHPQRPLAAGFSEGVAVQGITGSCVRGSTPITLPSLTRRACGVWIGCTAGGRQLNGRQTPGSYLRDGKPIIQAAQKIQCISLPGSGGSLSGFYQLHIQALIAALLLIQLGQVMSLTAAVAATPHLLGIEARRSGHGHQLVPVIDPLVAVVAEDLIEHPGWPRRHCPHAHALQLLFVGAGGKSAAGDRCSLWHKGRDPEY